MPNKEVGSEVDKNDYKITEGKSSQNCCSRYLMDEQAELFLYWKI